MRVLFVCLGNICRSPMAEGIFRHKIEKAGLEKQVEIDSAGTGAYHVGEPPDLRGQACLKSKDMDISGLRARQFQTSDFDEFDRIFAMDLSNQSDMADLARDANERQRVELFLELAPDLNVKSVPDPYFGGDDGFEHVFGLLDRACDVLLEQVQQNLAQNESST